MHKQVAVLEGPDIFQVDAMVSDPAIVVVPVDTGFLRVEDWIWDLARVEPFECGHAGAGMALHEL